MARSDDFKLKGEFRSPAKTMGPRALRTSGLIKQHAREVFLAKGYYGTSVEEIAESAGVSRASFYTYFPSKRDLLYSLGKDTYKAMAATLDEMRALEATWTTDDVYEVIRTYVRFLEEHGAFMLVWSQATYGDEALAKAGTRTRLVNARRFGEFIQRVSGETVDPAEEPALRARHPRDDRPLLVVLAGERLPVLGGPGGGDARRHPGRLHRRAVDAHGHVHVHSGSRFSRYARRASAES